MRNIFLIGPMGSGKTTIGRQLASRIGKEFCDTDKEIEKRTGVDVARIFEIEGEDGFRARETKMLKDLVSKNDTIIATGGGAILVEENRNCIKENGQVVYLKSSSQKLYDRTARDKKRPLLNTDDRMATIEELLKIRGPFYEAAADVIVSTDDEPVKQIMNKIINCLKLT
jgi:shikimate kinase